MNIANKKRYYMLVTLFVLSSESNAFSSFLKRQLASSRETIKTHQHQTKIIPRTFLEGLHES